MYNIYYVSAYSSHIIRYLVCIVHACSTACVRTDAPHNEGDWSEAKTEEITEPQRLQRNPAYCSIEMMKKIPMTYENVFL